MPATVRLKDIVDGLEMESLVATMLEVDGYELINEGKGCPALGYASCWQRKEGRR